MAASGSIHVGFFLLLLLLLLVSSSNSTLRLFFPSFLAAAVAVVPTQEGTLSLFSGTYYFPSPFYLLATTILRLANESWSGFLSRPRDVGGVTRFFAERLFPL